MQGRPVGTASRMHAALVRLQRLALAVVVLVVCGAMAYGSRAARPEPRIGPAMAAVDLALRHHSTAARPEPSRFWRAPHPAPELDLDAVETDDELDDDPVAHLHGEAETVRARPATPRDGARTPRGAPERDTSRFAVETGLPRGPPV